jgi:hypothetical protein
MSFTGLSERFSSVPKETESGTLGPGSYNLDRAGRLFENLKKRAHSQKAPAFGSGIVRQVGAVEYVKFTPGPGFYNAMKHKSSFNKEFMKSEED